MKTMNANIDKLQSSLEDHLTAIVRRFGVAVLYESTDGHSGWCISAADSGETCCATFECAAELFVAHFCTNAGKETCNENR